MTKTVFFDIDGTLTSKGNYIPETTIQAIAQLKENGIQPILATARPPLLIADVAKKLNINSYISMNGQYIVYEGEVIESNPLAIKMVDQLVDFANAQNDGIILCTDRELIINSRLSVKPSTWYLKIIKKAARFIPVSFELAIREAMMKQKIKKSDYANKDIYMMNLNVNRINEQVYINNFPSLHFTRANEHTLDVINHGVSKAKAVNTLLHYLQVDPADTIAFGDGLNDLEMIKLVGLGIAMGNGFEELKKAADMVTDSVHDDGIMKALKKIKLI